MDAASMIHAVVTDYFRIGGEYRSDDPGEAIVDSVLTRAILAGAVKTYVHELLFEEHRKQAALNPNRPGPKPKKRKAVKPPAS